MRPQPNPAPPLIQQYQFAKWLMRFPALTLMVYLRRDLGYRLLNPLALLATFGGLFVVAVLATPGNEAARPMDLAVFAVVGFLIGMVQRIRRWWSLNRGVQPHSYYIGSSPFSQKWLPEFLRRNRRAARFLDPIACAGLGLALLHISHALAMWLIFSAFCLRAYEFMAHDRRQNLELDITDSLIESEIQAQFFERKAHGQDASPELPDAGIPTGIGGDIKTKIHTRKHSNPSLN
jgi:hypothetical protein